MLRYGKGLSYHSRASSCDPSIAECARKTDDEDEADRDQRRDGALHANLPTTAGEILSKLMADGGLGGASLRHIESLSTTCRSMSASERTLGDSSPGCHEDDSQESPSIGGDSTRERQGISITVVSRASGRCAFPSSRRHTYVTYFRHDVSKRRVDEVLEEQLVEGREEMMGCSFATDAAIYRRGGDDAAPRGGKRRKYRGERNAAGERHGYGIYTSRNGNEYRGEWYEDRREGLGVVKVGNGKSSRCVVATSFFPRKPVNLIRCPPPPNYRRRLRGTIRVKPQVRHRRVPLRRRRVRPQPVQGRRPGR